MIQTCCGSLANQRVNSPRLARVPQQPGLIEHNMVIQHTQTSLPPGPRGLPVVGDALAFSKYPLGFLRRLERRYGRMATIHLGHQPFVLLFRPEQVRYVLMEQTNSD